MRKLLLIHMYFTQKLDASLFLIITKTLTILNSKCHSNTHLIGTFEKAHEKAELTKPKLNNNHIMIK